MRASSGIGTGVMVDTQVLIYACHHAIAASATGQVLRSIQYQQTHMADELEASAYVFRCYTSIYVSAITLLEFERACDATEAAWLQSLDKKLVPLPVDRKVADVAARLFREFQRIPLRTICPKCLNSKESKACSSCNSLTSASHKVADSLIAATAEVFPQVGKLYSYDGGIINGFAPRLRNCVVEKPPAPPPPPKPIPPAEPQGQAVQMKIWPEPPAVADPTETTPAVPSGAPKSTMADSTVGDSPLSATSQEAAPKASESQAGGG